MIFTNGEKCPVCDRAFTENDDIVICPQCGTPHHRECYNELGHCANRVRHDSGFEYSYKAEEEATADSNVTDSAEEYYYVPKDGNPVFTNDTYSNSSSDDEEIDGRRTSDIAAVVGNNSGHFLKYFRSGKKYSWNWSAFIFSSYYFLFRKMHLQGIIIMALKFAASLVVQGIFAKQMASYNDIMRSIYAMAQDGKSVQNIPDELINQFSSSYQALIPMIVISLVISLVISVFCGILADSFYKKKVFGILDRVEDSIANGGSFGVNPIFGAESNLSQEQMKALYLRRLGGVSIFAPIIAYAALDLISGFISNL